MATETLNSLDNLATVATRAVEAWNQAGKTLISAYRDGMTRAVLGATERAAAVGKQAKPSMFSDQMREQWLSTRKEWSDLVIQRVEADANNVMLVMDRAAVAATSSIDATLTYLQMTDTPSVRSLIDGAVALHLPRAQLSAQLAEAALKSASQIEARVNKADDEKTHAKKPAARTASKATA